MSFDWNNFFHLADYLFKNIPQSEGEGDQILLDEEAFYRTIVSRAYYATFCIARNKAQEYDGYEARGTTHQALQRYFTNNPQHKLRRKIGNQLKQLHLDRSNADYDNELKNPPQVAAGKALAQARNILDNLDRLYN